MSSIQLDFVLDNAYDFSGNPVTREAILAQLGTYNLTYTILAENGPAGGNPLLELTGTTEDITRYLDEVYHHGGEELAFYVSLIK